MTQVAALELLASSTHTLRRSWALTRGCKGKALALGVASFALVLVLVFVLGGVVAAVAGGLEAAATVLVAAMSLLIYPQLSCVFTLFYYGLRVRKEGFDLELLGQRLGCEP